MGFFSQHYCNFDDVSKIGWSGFLKTNVFWNKSDGTIINVHDVIRNILSRNSYYVVNVAIWPKIGNSSNFYNRSYHGINFIKFHQKTFFFEEKSWLKFKNLWLVLAKTLKFYSSLAKRLKLKLRKSWEQLIPTFGEVAPEELLTEPPHILDWANTVVIDHANLIPHQTEKEQTKYIYIHIYIYIYTYNIYYYYSSYVYIYIYKLWVFILNIWYMFHDTLELTFYIYMCV